MTYTSTIFLLLFLPLVILIYFISKDSLKLFILLLASFLFYVFTDFFYFILMVGIIWINFILGKQIKVNQYQISKSKLLLKVGLGINIILLLVFKIGAAYNVIIPKFILPNNLSTFLFDLVIPLGFSYITFQNISYLVDIHNELCDPEDNFLNFAFYTLYFPKILAGPIMLYRGMKEDITCPKPQLSRAYNGVRRIIIGLAKKVLIADTIARAINPSLDLPSPEFSTGIAWFILIGYTLQLYYDFSGITDMAIGMSEIFGLKLVENFNYPYYAQSISEFWRKWHISLSSWVRDYIFIPLEFKRRKVRFARQQINIIITFLVVGMWHGFTINFIIWGLYNGLILAIEMSFLNKLLRKIWKPIRHLYTICLILLGWIFFRSNSLAYGFKFLTRLFYFSGEVKLIEYSLTRPLPIIDHSLWITYIIGIAFAFPIIPNFLKRIIDNTKFITLKKYSTVGYDLFLFFLLLLSIASIVSTGTVGNIYAGF